ncbi:hypothetical protein FEM48_Zijuj03G0178300 [Ziziphus jujuba var. spinosa]|uniref:Longin domain-containing protein n=1 Tax=Ziziphus jujuba var. spinosa TaxID=714518 RepID=A0A978VRR5_ZIZJJ|nr:hypothetical protein FEM48_Zijuj03G0178300 [Ziziphus jujuba var. spinosa]
MISNPNLICYACIAKNTTILAQFSKESDLEDLAQQCIEKAPPYHSMFSQTVRERTYTFLLDDPFVYFAIFSQDLDQSEGIWFLNRLKSGFQESLKGGSMKGFDNFSSLCFQAEFDVVVREVMALNLKSDLDLVDSPPVVSNGSRNPSLDSSKGKKLILTPLLGKPIKGLKKKKRLSGESNGDFGKDLSMENKLDVCEDMSRDFSMSTQKNVTLHIGDRQKAKQAMISFSTLLHHLQYCNCFNGLPPGCMILLCFPLIWIMILTSLLSFFTIVMHMREMTGMNGYLDIQVHEYLLQ